MKVSFKNYVTKELISEKEVPDNFIPPGIESRIVLSDGRTSRVMDVSYKLSIASERLYDYIDVILEVYKLE
ncbi:hypothetical protein GW796_09675 [archaeon]|nr:hypothetical protein [archaeon]